MRPCDWMEKNNEEKNEEGKDWISNTYTDLQVTTKWKGDIWI